MFWIQNEHYENDAILKFHIRIFANHENLAISFENNESFDNSRIPCETYENQEKHKIICEENYQHHEIHKIPFENYENIGNPKVLCDNYENNRNAWIPFDN